MNSQDLDRTPQNVAYDQCPQYLVFIQQSNGHNTLQLLYNTFVITRFWI